MKVDLSDGTPCEKGIADTLRISPSSENEMIMVEHGLNIVGKDLEGKV